jgi:gamma-glutamyltranspeptidase / glutathione hydrolase
VSRIVVCPEPLAAEAGAEIFRLGGSAVDAALATAYAQAVVSPAMTSLAGNGILNLYHAPTRQNLVVDFLGRAGAGARPDMFVGGPPDGHFVGYRSILVPTFVRGTHLAFERFGSGRVSWAALLAPAIRFAEEGFTVYPYMHQYWRAEYPIQQTADPFDGYRMLATTPACAAVFTTDGRVHRIGERIVQRDLAATLRRLAAGGPEAFYGGDTGRRMAEDLAAHGAPVTAEDLAGCRAEVREPLRGSYRSLTVSTDPPPHIGVLLVELLNILEGYDLRALGLGSAAYFHLVTGALRLVFHDRARVMTDPVYADWPLTRMAQKAYAAELRQALCRVAGTTHVSTFDDAGSAVSFTHSIGTGSGVMTPGLGFVYNNNMMAFDPRPGRANSIAPGKAPMSGGGPTLLFDGDAVRAVLGSPHGSRKTSAMGHVIAGLVDFGLSPAAAVASPRIHCEADGPLLVEPFFPPPARVAAELTALGHTLRDDLYGGRVCLVWVDPATGRASGASDPRGGGGLAEV